MGHLAVAMFDEGPRISSHRGPCLDPGRMGVTKGLLAQLPGAVWAWSNAAQELSISVHIYG